jgi:hypothetical protein
MKIRPLCALLLLPSGCAPIVSSSLMVDGRPFVPVNCRSGERLLFPGIDLVDDHGQRLRLVQRPDGQADAYLLTAQPEAVTPLGQCGPMRTERQPIRIDTAYDLTGEATLNCRATGTLTFKNCH